MSSCGGVTAWCSNGRHDHCGHRLGGPQENGVWLPECYLTIPIGGRQVVPPAAWPDCSYPMVVSPSHRWRCVCDCHQAGQIPLFGAAS